MKNGFLHNKMKNRFKKMVLLDSSTDGQEWNAIWKRAFCCRSSPIHHHFVAYIFLNRKYLEKSLKIRLSPLYWKKFWSSELKPERLTRPQAGVKPPFISGPNKRSAEGTKDLSPLQGFVIGWILYPGATPPSVVLTPLWGYMFKQNFINISRDSIIF